MNPRAPGAFSFNSNNEYDGNNKYCIKAIMMEKATKGISSCLVLLYTKSYNDLIFSLNRNPDNIKNNGM